MRPSLFLTLCVILFTALSLKAQNRQQYCINEADTFLVNKLDREISVSGGGCPSTSYVWDKKHRPILIMDSYLWSLNIMLYDYSRFGRKRTYINFPIFKSERVWCTDSPMIKSQMQFECLIMETIKRLKKKEDH